MAKITIKTYFDEIESYSLVMSIVTSECICQFKSLNASDRENGVKYKEKISHGETFLSIFPN